MPQAAWRLTVLLSIGVLRTGAVDANDELLARIRRHMAENLARLPNYTCRETIERASAAAGSRHFELIDRLRLEVAYIGGRELYAWPGEATFEDRSIEDIVGTGGAIGYGNFAMHARVVFTTNAPEFSEGAEEQRDGHPVVRYDFHVTRNKSRYAIQTGAAPIVVAYDGFVEADPETLDPLQMEVRPVDLPPELKLRSAHEIMQYGRLRIGDSDFLLPKSSELSMVGAAGVEDRNLSRFEACKEYSGESTIRFDVDENGAPTAQSAVPIVLPRDVYLEANLRGGIDKDQAARGDLISAIVASNVKKSGQVIVPKGAVLTGRITGLETRTARSAVYFGVGMRFQTIEFGGRHGNFSADMQMAGIGTDYSVAHNPQTGDSVVYIKSKVERLLSGTRLVFRTR